MKHHNAEKTCWNCPCIDFKGSVDFRACGQSMKEFLRISGKGNMQAMVECKRRPEIGMFDPASITFEDPHEINPIRFSSSRLALERSEGLKDEFLASLSDILARCESRRAGWETTSKSLDDLNPDLVKHLRGLGYL